MKLKITKRYVVTIGDALICDKDLKPHYFKSKEAAINVAGFVSADLPKLGTSNATAYVVTTKEVLLAVR